jgi:nucleoside-diphosphate-sugar epimerase
MKLKTLITGSNLQLSQDLANALSPTHEVTLTDSALNHTPNTNNLVRGTDVIIHSGEVDLTATASDQLDYQMRCTYNLLRAATEEGVPRFIFLSSLQLMDGYNPDMAVTERWKTTPTTDLPVLCYHLGEMVCREFAREGKINVIMLRLGEITPESSTNPSTSALYMDDAISAVEKALTAETSGWLDIFHIQSDVPNARYLTGQPWWSAEDVSQPVSLGYAPSPNPKTGVAR